MRHKITYGYDGILSPIRIYFTLPYTVQETAKDVEAAVACGKLGDTHVWSTESDEVMRRRSVVDFDVGSEEHAA